MVIDLMTRDFNYYTNNAMKPLVLLDEEMAFIENYLEILKIRFDNKLDYNIENFACCEDILIPPFSFQPLVENAVKHASLKDDGRRTVNIILEGDGSSFMFSVSNPTVIEGDTKKGRTHNNILSRLEYYFTSVMLTLSVEDKNYFAVLKVDEESL